MKKMFSFGLSFILAVSMGITAFAAESGNTNVTYEVNPTYTVTIPESVTIGETATVSAHDVVINKGKHIEVALTASDFKVKTDKGAELNYTVIKDGNQVNLGDTVLAVEPGDNNSGSSVLAFNLADGETVKYAGEYKGLVTFTIGIEKVSIEISTPEQLASFRDRVNNGETSLNAILMKDIDLGGSEENQWVPIGTDYDTQFNGNFDGNEHKISGLYINNSMYYLGLFGWIGKSGIVKNLGVDGEVKGSYDADAGGITGFNDGKIENCYNTGTISGKFVGGVTGYNSYGTVKNCCNTGIVSGKCAGGVAGRNVDNTVMCCCNTGTVIGTARVGGVVGQNFETVENCYNTGAISGESSVGGVIGQNFGTIGTVDNCYNIGTVKSTVGAVGGVTEYSESTIRNCYYLDTCGAGGLGTSLTKEQFKDQSNFDDWNFGSVWQMNDTLGRPTLIGVSE